MESIVKMLRMSILFVFVTVIFTAAPAVLFADDATKYLVQDGVARSVIVRQVPGTNVSEAVAELQNDVRRATGATLPIVDVDDLAGLPADTMHIVIGPGPYAQSLGFTPGALDEEEYRVVTTGNNLVFMGSFSDADLWAVTYFLDHVMGVRWLWPGETGTYVPKTDTIAVPELDVTTRPPLEWRKLRIPTGAPEEGAYWLRLHQMGSRTTYEFGHSFTKWWNKYGAAHPEYFAVPPAGQQQVSPGNIKLDIGNPAVDDVIIQEWQAAGAPASWNVSPNDSTGFCVSAACLAMDTPSGQSVIDIWRGNANLTARYVRFWNRLLDKMRLIRPDVELTAYAYSAYKEPPPPGVELNDGMVLGVVNSFSNYDAWDGWSDAGASLFLRPNWWYSGFVAPYMPLHGQGNYFKYAQANGIKGFDFDSLFGNWGTQGPSYYVIGRLTARPDLSVDDIIGEYASAFGNAAPAIENYLDYWEQFAEEAIYPDANSDRNGPGWYASLSREKGFSYSSYLGSYYILPYLYTDTVLGNARAFLDQAEQLATGDDEALARIAFLRDGLQHLELLREVVRYGYEKTRPADATWEQFDLLRQQLETFRQNISDRHVVWGGVLDAFEENRNLPTVDSRTQGWTDRPKLTNVTPGPLAAGEPVTATSSVYGTLYLVPSATAATRAAIESVGASVYGRMAAVSANIPATLDTTGLATNLYYMYVITPLGSIAPPSDGIAVLDSHMVLVDNRDAIVRSSGGWTFESDAGFIGNTKQTSQVQGSYVDIPFRGKMAKVISLKSPTQGNAAVYVDGQHRGTISFYSSTRAFQQEIFSTGLLPEGVHVIRIEVLGQATPPGTGKYVSFDALQVLSPAPLITGVTDGGLYADPVTVTFGSPIPGLTYTATWNGTPFASGGTISAEGQHSLTVRDMAGNVTTVAFRIDRTAPLLELGTNAAPLNWSDASLYLHASAQDSPGSGVVSITVNNAVYGSQPIVLNTALGQHVYEVKARDAAGHSSVQTLAYAIYQYEDLTKELVGDIAPAANSTIPLKFRIIGGNGTVTNAAATVVLEGASSEVGEFTWRGNHYQYNLNTQGFAPGDYSLQLRISLNGVQFPIRSIPLQLR
ncbi:DUF4838 domain-containing protein [Paenibacillus ginsengarvi]|uniref:DUF4838 domain-containing protein n=2 Tax=Paenibacillus ginsengarvi TaxID=400777 RepID=A0A3B0CNB7_9BACL|nr:DUF4838 domain-containing protein [Paenibacillus ginsengarvi]